MLFVTGFTRAVLNCFRGFSILFRPGFRRYLVIPLLVWVLLFAASLAGSFALATWLIGLLPPEFSPAVLIEKVTWLQEAAPFLLTAITLLLKLLIQFLFFMVGGTLLKYAVIVLLSPMLALLSEKTETHLSGRSFPFSLATLLRDTVRGTIVSLRYMLLEYAVMISAFFITLLLPALVVVTVPLTLLMSWYFTGASLMYYNCERHGYTIAQSTAFMRRQSGYVSGTGCVYAFFLALPFAAGTLIGLMLGPALAVIGSTITFTRLNNRDQVSEGIATAYDKPPLR